jgi:hypothetical protein
MSVEYERSVGSDRIALKGKAPSRKRKTAGRAEFFENMVLTRLEARKLDHLI